MKNTKYAPFWYHSDHLGSSSYITNLSGEINQHMEYLPFGETLIEEHLNSYNSPFKFNAKEFDAETGNYYYGARYYDPKWSLWLSVDPLHEEYPGWSPYTYTLLNPVIFIDPDGRSTGVKDNGDGTYTVVSGNVNDGNKGIFIVDDDGNYDAETSKMIANSITTHSFFDANEEVVKGAVIDMNSNEGQEFTNQLIQDNPSLLSYMWNARNGEKYDFKEKGIKDRGDLTREQYRYRGSVSSNGDVGSARDFGNMGAGMVAARKGLSWKQARAGFDLYQGYKSNGITPLPTPGSIKGGSGGIPIPTVFPEREATTSIKAQMTGYLRGLQRFK